MAKKESDNFSERDILYKVLFEMKQDVTEMKRVIVDLLNNNNLSSNEKNSINYQTERFFEIGWGN